MGKSFCWEWSQHQNQRPFSELLPSLAQECGPEAVSQQGGGPVWSERSAALRGGLWRLQKALHRQVHKDLSACESASRVPVKMSQARVLSVHLLVCLPAGVCVRVCARVCVYEKSFVNLYKSLKQTVDSRVQNLLLASVDLEGRGCDCLGSSSFVPSVRFVLFFFFVCFFFFETVP